MKEYKLPRIMYGYSGLEPHIDEATMKLHHLTHHANYVKGTNKVFDEHSEGLMLHEVLEEVCVKKHKGYDSADFKNLLLMAGGHFNHTFYFKLMNPPRKSETEIDEQLYELIKLKWGTLEKFKEFFETKALKTVGSGWVYLVYASETVELFEETEIGTLSNKMGTKIVLNKGELHIVATKNQEMPLMYSKHLIPIIAMDIWEHAYYIKHNANKKGYVHDFFCVLDWSFVSTVFLKTKDSKEKLCVDYDGELLFK